MAFFFTKISANSNYIMKKLLLVAALFATTSSILAEEISNLKQSASFALTHNRVLAADVHAVEKVSASLSDATGRMLPRVDLTAGAVRTNAPGDYFGLKLSQQSITAADFNPAVLNNPGYINNYQTRIGVMMPLFQGGALWAGRKLASHHADASHYGHEYLKQQILFQTVSAYARVKQAAAQIIAVKRAVSAAKKRFQDAEQMQKRGILIKSDVMDARVHLLRTTVRLQEAENSFAASREMLEQVIGADSQVVLSTEDEPYLKMKELSLDQTITEALASRPDLIAMQSAYEAASAGVDQSRASFLPHVSLVAAQEWNASTLSMKNRNSMVGATVTMNLFSGGSDTAKLRSAEAEVLSIELKRDDLKQKIRNEVSQAWRQLAESRLRYESENEALKQSEESLRIKSLRYQQGLSKTSDLLDAQVQADSARVSTIRARYDVTVAEAALLLATGILSEGVIQ